MTAAAWYPYANGSGLGYVLDADGRGTWGITIEQARVQFGRTYDMSKGA